MLNRLNGWQRIGVVLTVLWAIFILAVGAVGFASLASGKGPFVYTIKGKVERIKGKDAYCTEPAPPLDPNRHTFTWDEAMGCAPGALVEGTPDREVEVIADQHRFMYEEFVGATIMPPLLVWLLAYTLVAVIRWIAKGFRRKAT
jgi:hypothetical protein